MFGKRRIADGGGGRIKLLQFVTLFGTGGGGTERHVANLARTINRSIFDLRLVCFHRWGEFLAEIAADHVPVTHYKIDSLYRPQTFRQQLQFARDLRRERIQILHTYGFYPNVFALPAARLAGVPVTVASIRDLGNLGTRAQQLAQRIVCRLSDHILVNAEAVRQHLIAQGYDGSRISVIRNGVDVTRFAGTPHRGQLHQELGLPASAPLVVTLARLVGCKGLEYFLDAAAMVASRFDDARFVIVGGCFEPRSGAIVSDPDYRSELQNRADRLGLGRRVLFMGFRLDVPELLSEATVSVLPSLSEGLSNTLLESMAAGVPVVATSVGGTPEVVADEVTGLLVPPQDPGALASAICRVLESPRFAARLGDAGKQRVIEHFSLDHMVRQTERLYVTMLDNVRRVPAGGRVSRYVGPALEP